MIIIGFGLALLLGAAFVFVTIASVRWVIAPLFRDPVAVSQSAAMQFGIFDLICLFLQLQFVLAGLLVLCRLGGIAQTTVPLTVAAIAFVPAACITWWGPVHGLSRAGILSLKSRAYVLLVAAPGAFVCAACAFGGTAFLGFASHEWAYISLPLDFVVGDTLALVLVLSVSSLTLGSLRSISNVLADKRRRRLVEMRSMWNTFAVKDDAARRDQEARPPMQHG